MSSSRDTTVRLWSLDELAAPALLRATLAVHSDVRKSTVGGAGAGGAENVDSFVGQLTLSGLVAPTPFDMNAADAGGLFEPTAESDALLAAYFPHWFGASANSSDDDGVGDGESSPARRFVSLGGTVTARSP